MMKFSMHQFSETENLLISSLPPAQRREYPSTALRPPSNPTPAPSFYLPCFTTDLIFCLLRDLAPLCLHFLPPFPGSSPAWTFRGDHPPVWLHCKYMIPNFSQAPRTAQQQEFLNLHQPSQSPPPGSFDSIDTNLSQRTQMPLGMGSPGPLSSVWASVRIQAWLGLTVSPHNGQSSSWPHVPHLIQDSLPFLLTTASTHL